LLEHWPISFRWDWTAEAVVLAFCAALAAAAGPAAAQDPLYLVNDSTRVRDVSFRFVDDPTFEVDRLHNQIATQAPSVLTRLRNVFAFLPFVSRRTFAFDPVTLQKDVVRLRTFYQQQGFLQAKVDYPTSQFDTTSNSIHVIFTVREGPPVIIQDTQFLGTDGEGYAVEQFTGDLRTNWIDFRDRTSFRLGDRYTEFNRVQIEDQVRTWLRDQGYAFAQVSSTADVDTSARTADIRFLVDAGPRATVDRIDVDGNESVSRSVVLREIPVEPGELFSATALKKGQQELFRLNLFRVAIADVPDQPRDSTVTVRYRVREGKLRTVTGELGYGVQTGVSGSAQWSHRNFFGDARNFTAGLTAETGRLAQPRFLPDGLFTSTLENEKLYKASVSLNQPYFFNPNLSLTLSPFILERKDKNLSEADRFEGLNEREFGIDTTILYEFLPFRTLSLQHSLSRTQQFGPDAGSDDGSLPQSVVGEFATGTDLFDSSVFSLTGTFGKTDDFINPTRGYLLRPTVRLAGVLGSPVIESDIQFASVNVEASGYLPVGDHLDLAGRLTAGRLWPLGASKESFSTAPTDANVLSLASAENQFDRFLFYAGGGTDLRGWPNQLAGPKFVRPSQDVAPFAYEAIGATTKLGFNLEARLPFPGLGSSWRTAVFLDGAYLSNNGNTLAPQIQYLEERFGATISSDRQQVLVGTGGGVRYETPVGFLRVDLAYKLTTDRLDLRNPVTLGDQIETTPLPDVDTRFIRNFRLHFGLGRTF
jgi:outer membrane protein insertion porin family